MGMLVYVGCPWPCWLTGKTFTKPKLRSSPAGGSGRVNVKSWPASSSTYPTAGWNWAMFSRGGTFFTSATKVCAPDLNSNWYVASST